MNDLVRFVSHLIAKFKKSLKLPKILFKFFTNEIKSKIYLKPIFVLCTRLTNTQHPFSKIETSTTTHSSSCLSLWFLEKGNTFCASFIFSCNLKSFPTQIHKFTNPKILSLPGIQRSIQIYKSSTSSIHINKKITEKNCDSFVLKYYTS